MSCAVRRWTPMSYALLLTLTLTLITLFSPELVSSHSESDLDHDIIPMIVPLNKLTHYEVIPRITPIATARPHPGQTHPHILHYRLQACNVSWEIRAVHNEHLFTPNYEELVWIEGRGLVKQDGKQAHHDHCYYIGSVTNAHTNDLNAVALYTCDGVHGTIQADGIILHVQPSLTDPKASIVFHDSWFQRAPLKFESPSSTHDHSTYHPVRTSSRTFQSLASSDLSITRWVELLVVNDYPRFSTYRAGTSTESASIANRVDSLYYSNQLTPPLRVRLVAQVTFQTQDPYYNKITFLPNGQVEENSLLTAFMKWAANPANNLTTHDNHQLYSGYHFRDNIVGYAPVGQMCNFEQSAAIISHVTQDEQGTALTATHEMGHNLGMEHDGTIPSTASCPTSGYIMAAVAMAGVTVTDFSSCSKNLYTSWYKSTGATSQSQCLENVPTREWKQGVCGDGVLEGDELCDCGAPGSAGCLAQPCCVPQTCKFIANATCSDGTNPCCDGKTCQLRRAGTVCRPAVDPTCDMAETCDGKVPTCPEDSYQPAGVVCSDGFNKTGGMCYIGYCLSLNTLCNSYGSNYIACPTSKLPDPTAYSKCTQSYCILNNSADATCVAKPDPKIAPGTIPNGYGCDVGKQCLAGKCVPSSQLNKATSQDPPQNTGTIYSDGVNPLFQNSNLIMILIIIAAVAIGLSLLLCVYRKCKRYQAKRSGQDPYVANMQLNIYQQQQTVLPNGLTVYEVAQLQQMELAEEQEKQKKNQQLQVEQESLERAQRESLMEAQAREKAKSIPAPTPAPAPAPLVEKPIAFKTDEEAIQALLAQEEADRRERDRRRAEAGLPPLNEPINEDEKLIRELLAQDAEILKKRQAGKSVAISSVPVKSAAPMPNSVTVVAPPQPQPAMQPQSPAAPGGISISAAAPSPLPLGWSEHTTSQGVAYWFNSVTGKTAWSRPTE